MTEQEKSCAQCVYCIETPDSGYEGGCNKHGFYLQTIDDRLCKEFVRREE